MGRRLAAPCQPPFAAHFQPRAMDTLRWFLSIRRPLNERDCLSLSRPLSLGSEWPTGARETYWLVPSGHNGGALCRPSWRGRPLEWSRGACVSICKEDWLQSRAPICSHLAKWAARAATCRRQFAPGSMQLIALFRGPKEWPRVACESSGACQPLSPPPVSPSPVGPLSAPTKAPLSKANSALPLDVLLALARSQLHHNNVRLLFLSLGAALKPALVLSRCSQAAAKWEPQMIGTFHLAPL